MSVAGLVAAGCLIALAALHTWLGERLLLGPLLAAEPWPATPLGRAFARRTIRFAWHLTSIAWLGLAAVVAWAREPLVPGVVSAVLLASGAIAYAAARGRHFAWALFLAGGIAGAVRASGFGGPARAGVAWACAGVFAGLALLHVAWAAGMRWGIDAALPSVAGRRTLSPGRSMTLAVALALAFSSWLALGLGGLVPAPPGARWLGIAGAAVLAARLVGDRSALGLLKRVRGTPFARWDDLLYCPLCFLLGASLLLLAVAQ